MSAEGAIMKKLYLVMPCFNEQDVIEETARRLEQKLNTLIQTQKIEKGSKAIFVDDGSSDRTWELIQSLSDKSELFGGVKLSCNKGHQNALLAGLMSVRDECDYTISMDVDLQDDIETIDKMVDKYNDGCQIVYGVRNDRTTDTAFKRNTAQSYYKIMGMMGVDIVYNHADFRLMSSQALGALSEFREVNLFLRGLVPLLGFRTDTVEYARGERFAGESKYPLKKMLGLAFDGITSFSLKPIRMISAVGVGISCLSIIALIYSLVSKMFFYTDIGWTSVICSIWLIGGIQLLALGVIGEYIAKIYLETKQRPRFIVEKTINIDGK